MPPPDDLGPTDLTEAPSGPVAPDRLWTVFAYLPGSSTLLDWVDLLEPLPLGFTPTRVETMVLGQDTSRAPFDDGTWDRIRTAGDAATGFRLEEVEREGRDDEHVRADLMVVVARLSSEVLLSGVEPDPALVATLVAAPGLIGGERGDEVDASWQGEAHPPHFELYYDGPWQHLPRTTDKRGRERIDVSGNPGRMTEVAGWRMWAAQDDWYGPGARRYLDLDALARLDVGTVTDLGGDRWHVRLWEDGASLADIRAAQRALRERLGFDGAHEKARDLTHDPHHDQPS